MRLGSGSVVVVDVGGGDVEDEVGLGVVVVVDELVVEELVELLVEELVELLDEVELLVVGSGACVVVGSGSGSGGGGGGVYGAGAFDGRSVCGFFVTLPGGGSCLTGSPSRAPIM